MPAKHKASNSGTPAAKEVIDAALIEQRLQKLEVANRDLRLKVASLEGKNLHLTNQVQRLEENCEKIAAQGLKRNLVFHNLPDKKNEDCSKTVLGFIRDELLVTADVGLDVAYRLGRFSAQAKYPRPLVGLFTTQGAVNLLKEKARSLKGKKYFITDQVTREARSRQAALAPTVKKLREDNPTSAVSVRQDKILLDGQEVNPNFTKNPLTDAPGNPKTIYFDQLSHTIVHSEKGSKFQGHGRNIRSLQDAQAAKDALFQDASTADSTHLIYAYCLRDTSSNVLITGHSDDGEWTAGARLAATISSLKTEDVFIAVSRKYGGVDLGKRRFELITLCAKQALAKLLPDNLDDTEESE